MDLSPLLPRADLLVAAVALDAVLGDPVYRGHPVRLMGASLAWCERGLRASGADGRIGGCLLFVLLGALWVGGLSLALAVAARLHPAAGAGAHLFVLYSLLALGDLLAHGAAVDRAATVGDLPAARRAVARLVGRDVDRMDAAACRRAAIESLAENLVDGVISPIAWYAVLGVPGLVLCKVVSTMDSMVGYRTPRYLRFGWCGARLDDLMQAAPARATWLLIALAASALPGCSGRGALATGWRQHAVVPGPNPGWSEAAMAGALTRRLAGPIRLGGRLVTEIWLGDPADVPAGAATDYRQAHAIVRLAAALALAAAVGGILSMRTT